MGMSGSERRKFQRALADRVAYVLNRALRSDSQAINWLFEYRVQCNDRLVGDPTIQVRSRDNNPTSVGILGILNGIIGDASEGALVVAEVDQGTEKIVKFSVADNVRSFSSIEDSDLEDTVNLRKP